MLGRSVRRRGNVESHDRWRVPVHGIHATRAGVHRGAAQREHGATATRARTLLASATVIFAHRPPPTSTALHPPPQPRVFQSHRSDLNRRPLDYESRALPLSYGGGGPKVSNRPVPAVLSAGGRGPRSAENRRPTRSEERRV